MHDVRIMIQGSDSKQTRLCQIISNSDTKVEEKHNSYKNMKPTSYKSIFVPIPHLLRACVSDSIEELP